jgi:uncharacterized protein YdaU (DUF1376 family)
MSRAWMPLYIGDFLADTMHLGATERGIYISLIIHCWQHGSIPRDKRKLARIAACDSRLWWQYRRTVLQFFDVVDASTMQHRRVNTELHRYAELSNKRKAAAKHMHAGKTASAEHLHTPSPSPSPSHTTEEPKEGSSVVALAAKRGSRLVHDWYPSDADLKFAADLGLRLFEVDNEAAKFLDYWSNKPGKAGVMLDWSKTWRNWCRRALEQQKGKGNDTGRKQTLVERGQELARKARELENSEALRRKNEPIRSD